MPTFVGSLFLPYTVDFHEEQQQQLRGPSPPKLRLPFNRKDSTADIKQSQSQLSLFSGPTPPLTPSASTEAQEFFSKQLPSAKTEFLKAHDPRGIVRSDSHVPDWGNDRIFNQPRSRAEPPLPDNILDYHKAQERARSSRHRRTLTGTLRPGQGIKSPRSPKDGGSDHFASSEWTIESAVQGNGGLANAIRATSDETLEDTIWVGNVGFPTDALSEPTKAEIAEKLESEYNALAVYVSDSDFDGHYAHYCKTILWPVFHYQIPDHPKSKAYEDHSWIYYVHLNQAFADKIVKSYKRGDIIWIHDYHLLLVPHMIRKKLPDAQIGFFLHTAFPSSEVFRCLSTRKELLEGMLGANLVAFQTKEYAQHFLTTCTRLLVVEATTEGVQLDDHFVNVAAIPIGIDPQALAKARQEAEVHEWIDMMKERYKDKKVIVARDKLDHVRGVRQKLLAFELFLNKYPEWREKVVLIQVATSTTENSELAATVSDIVTRIDSTHSTLAHQPLVFLKQDISFSQYIALLTLADVLMITSLREGMNLTAHEYIMCQDGKGGVDKAFGPLILSEFTGSASVLGEYPLSINPWDYQKCAEAIKRSLEMPEDEKKDRWNGLQKVVTNQTGGTWTKNLIEALAKVHEEHHQREPMSIPRLPVTQVSQKYRATTRRVFILDYEGTLASFTNPTNIVMASPQRVIDTLNDLMLDDANIVYVMSGRTPEELQDLFHQVPGLGIIAENGCFLREYNNSAEWVEIADVAAMQVWKASVKQILQYYQERIEGSRIEERHCSIIFHYENAEDPEAAARQAGDCANHINDACENQRVHAVPTDKAVLIEPLDWSKGSAVTHIFDRLREMNTQVNGLPMPDFLFVAGDDREDEVVFRWANKLGTDGIIKNVTTVSVGKRNTEAMTTLTQGTTGLLTALQRIARFR